jgi:drug/metabolite transporter (DMT)-like permease
MRTAENCEIPTASEGIKRQTPTTSSNYLKGAVFGFATVLIWASWSAITRLAVTTSLDAWDIAALRFGVAGLLLVPIVLRRGLARDRLGWLGLAMIVAGLGAPYVLVAAAGLRFAPASDQGALNPGCMPLFVAVIAAVVVGERLATTRKLGLALILAGALVIVGWHVEGRSGGWTASRSFGDALFLCASFLTACFTVVMSRAKLDPVHAAALVATGSLVIYLPVYLALFGTHLARLSFADLAIQAMFQGILVTIVSVVLYGRAVATLGASGGAAFGALVPALSALFAIPLLGEWPGETDWGGIVLISAGVYLASGGPLPGDNVRRS